MSPLLRVESGCRLVALKSPSTFSRLCRPRYVDARKIGVGRIERRPLAITLLVQPKPSCVGYSPPPPRRSVVTTSYFSSSFALLVWLMCVGPFLLVQAPVVVLSASIAVWFFYAQHQFEGTHWAHDGDWTFHDAALNGTSHYELPPAFPSRPWSVCDFFITSRLNTEV